MRRIVILVAGVALAIAAPAIADKGGNGHTDGGGTSSGGGGGSPNGGGGKSSTQGTVTNLSIVSEYVQNSPNPAAPTWCLNEDDYDQRTLSGTLSGGFSTSYELCDPNVDYSGGIWWGAGGIGLQADVYAVGTLADLTITSPLGDAHHALLVGSSTSKGVTTDHYQVCYTPPYSISNDIGGRPLTGGAWQVTLTGQLSKVSWTVNARMTDAPWQQDNCPPSQQNLVP